MTTPPAIVEKLSKAAQAAIQSDSINTWLSDYGMDPKGTDAKSADQFMADETPKWLEAIKLADIKKS